MEKERYSVRSAVNQVIKLIWWNNQPQQGAQTQQSSQNSRQAYNISEHPQDQPIQTLQPDQTRGLQDLRPAAQQLQQSSQSEASTHYGSVSSVLSHPGQVGGFSGHRFNINHFTQRFNSEVGVKDICA